MTKAIQALLLATVLFDLAASAADAKQLQGGPLVAPKFDGIAAMSDMRVGSPR